MLKHIAIIADGNRRWAKLHNLPISQGYLEGLNTIESICEWAIEKQIPYLTFYCFSTENWNRPPKEIDTIMSIGSKYIIQKNWYVNHNIRVKFYGRTDRLSQHLVKNCQIIEEATQNCNALNLTICLDYGGRDDIITAISQGITTEKEMNEYMTQYFPNPDIILRTGGQYRLSNFLLWQSAYAELFFINELFPDLNVEILNNIIINYDTRTRNYGG